MECFDGNLKQWRFESCLRRRGALENIDINIINFISMQRYTSKSIRVSKQQQHHHQISTLVSIITSNSYQSNPTPPTANTAHASSWHHMLVVCLPPIYAILYF